MNQEAYLQRINYQGPILPSLDVLQQLQKHHLLDKAGPARPLRGAGVDRIGNGAVTDNQRGFGPVCVQPVIQLALVGYGQQF